MNRRPVDLLIVLVIAIVAVALVFTVAPDNVPIRIFTLPLVLVLPGYALTSALFTKRAPSATDCIAFSLGLSLVIVIVGGLVLNLTPFGLRANSWSVFLGSITLVACATALIRRRRQNIAPSKWLRVSSIGLTFRQGLLLGLSAVVVSGAIAISIIGATHQPFSGFTQLWILPAGGTNSKNVVRLGVSNMESTAMAYRLTVSVDGKVVKEWPSLDLKLDEQWEVTLVVSQKGHAARVEALLYRANTPTTVYRHVVLWLGT